jgi:hypothetical protein
MKDNMLKALEAERSQLLEDLRAIEAVLRRCGRLRDGGESPSPQPTLFEADTPSTERQADVPKGLRAAITHVLEGQTQGLKPVEVTRQLEAIGFDAASAKTKLTVRVAGEMSRMKKAGRLKKTSTGRYKLAE